MTTPKAPDRRKNPARPRDAASVVVLRGSRNRPEVLLGRRRLDARFMPGVYVFPGGRVDRSDTADADGYPLREDVMSKLRRHCTPRRARALVWAAIRETWEESGLLIGKPGNIRNAHRSPLHAAYAAAGLSPQTAGLDYIFRAITPTHSPIRFNTRFFLASAEDTHGSLRRSGELEDIGWRSAAQAINELDLRNVTRLALREAVDMWRDNPEPDPARKVKLLTTRIDVKRVTLE